VVNFVAATRRWHDRRKPRDAGERHACQIPKNRSLQGGFPFTHT